MHSKLPCPLLHMHGHSPCNSSKAHCQWLLLSLQAVQKPSGRQDKLPRLEGRPAAHGPAIPDCMRLPPDPAAEHERLLKAQLIGKWAWTPAGVDRLASSCNRHAMLDFTRAHLLAPPASDVLCATVHEQSQVLLH